jgi:hypothetical protein
MKSKILLNTIAATLLLSSYVNANEIVQPDTLLIAQASLNKNAVTSNIVNGERAYSISFTNGGLVWSVEDPNLVNPVYQVASLPYVGFENGRVTTPLEFYVRSNYAAFIQRAEISIYRATDQDLTEPLVTIPVNPTSFTKVVWDGRLPDNNKYNVGDELFYMVRIYDKDGRFDETSRQSIQLIKPYDVQTSLDNLKDTVSKEQGASLSQDEAIAQYLLNSAFMGNSIVKQNIPIYGSTIIIRGNNIPDGNVYINNEQIPLNFERNFAAEYLMPVGTHDFNIKLIGSESISETLSIDVSGSYFFGVGIADFTIGKAKISGSGKDDMFNSDDTDLFKDGRLAFYLKGKAYSKYTVTAQADTTERNIKHLFSGFARADADNVFESLDPDMYYPTYGDDSTTFRDVDTQGKFYVRLDWDKSNLLWGNYNTGFTGTRYAQYSRSLYGAALDWRSIDSNEWGDPRTIVKAFGSETKTAAGHTEFIGTGGSLYYLKHMNILDGSDKIVLEVKDLATGKVLANVELIRGADYEIDTIQGRIILSRPLSQITRQSVKSITTTTPLSGYEQRLIVDYEYVSENSFEADFITAGIRAKHWLNDYIGVGGTYVKEEASGDDYEIRGVDLTLQAGLGTYIKGEYTKTNSRGAPMFYSDNGGLSFVELGSGNKSGGDAIAVDAKVNFKELGLVSNDISVASWYRNTDDGYSQSRSFSGSEITEYGGELVAEITKNWRAYTQVSKAKRDSDEYTEAQLTTTYNILDKATISAEVKHTNSNPSGSDSVKGTLGALRVDYDITPYLEAYATGQFTIDDDKNAYDNNDAVILGTRYMFTDSSSISAEYTTGHRGEALQVDASYQLGADHTIYGGYTWANGYSSDFDSVFNANKNSGWTLGQRWNITDQVMLYNESQMIREKGSRGATNSVGMDFLLGEGYTLGVLYQKGELEAISSSGDVTRDALSFSVGRTTNDINWLSKLEYRKDTGAERREQWVTTNRLTYKVNESLRLAARFNWSDTDDKLNSQNGAKFTEGNLGFAYRPFNSSKWALFGRYTYLYDLSTIGQINGVDYDQRTQIFSLEGVFKPDGKWEFALKVADRYGEYRMGRGVGTWFDSRTTFYAAQIRYDILYKWHALLEYRVLDVKDGGLKQGVMIGLDRDITENFRIGAGYNFTDFSDDLTKYDYKYKGWYLNVLGTY